MPTQVDLRPFEEEIRKWLLQSVVEFSQNHPEKTVSTLGIHYAGLNPLLSLAFDSKEHADKVEQQDPADAGEDIGTDEFGRFSRNPHDFDIMEGGFGFDGFPDLYDLGSDRILEFTLPDGSTTSVDLNLTGDPGIWKVMFQFLSPIVERFAGFKDLKRSASFRIGLYFMYGDIIHYWHRGNTSLKHATGVT